MLYVRDELVGPAAGVGVAGEEDDPLVGHAALVPALLLTDHLRFESIAEREGSGRVSLERHRWCVVGSGAISVEQHENRVNSQLNRAGSK